MKPSEKIKAAFDLISRVSVSGDIVDIFAEIRRVLREGYKEATQLEVSYADLQDAKTVEEDDGK